MIRNLPKMQIAEKVSAIPQALSIYINQIVYDLRRRGRDVVTLSLGEAFFDIPQFDFKKIDVEKGAHYSDSQGIPELRRKIAEYYRKHYGAPVDSNTEILITAGSKPAIFMAMQATLNPGDEIAIHEPAWLSYQEQARLVGARPIFIPFDCPVGDFSRHYGPRTRMVVINNPNNPAGRIYSRQELTTLYADARGRGIYVMVDEAYSDFVIDDPFVSLAEVAPDKDGAIVINSLSKNLGISGWRVGYVIAHPVLIKEILKLNQHLITCAPSILLYYLAQYFEQITAVTLPQVRQLIEKRRRVSQVMDGLGLKRLAGESTFYFFVSIGEFPGTSLDFAIHMLLEHDVAVVPGSAYGLSTERFVRVSIGTESEERIAEALEIIRDLIHIDHFDPTPARRKLTEMGIGEFKAGTAA